MASSVCVWSACSSAARLVALHVVASRHRLAADRARARSRASAPRAGTKDADRTSRRRSCAKRSRRCRTMRCARTARTSSGTPTRCWRRCGRRSSKVQDQLADVDKAREGSYRAVAAQLTALAGAQQRAARRRRGSVALAAVAERARQVGRNPAPAHRRTGRHGRRTATSTRSRRTTRRDGGRQTPDLIVRLPGDAIIVVDAKVPIDGYLAATEAKTDAERDAELAAHVRQVRDHIRALGAKEYWQQFHAVAGVRRDVPAARAAARRRVRTGADAARSGGRACA